jgi:acyl-CoA-binding protein
MLWDAWNAVKGETKDEAKVNFIAKGEDVLRSHGFSTDDPA